MDDLIYISDLGLASAIFSSGIAIVDLDKSNPRKVKFIFQNSKALETISNDYWNGVLSVNALEFFQNIRVLKNRLYQTN